MIAALGFAFNIQDLLSCGRGWKRQTRPALLLTRAARMCDGRRPMKIPATGLSKDDLFQRLEAFRAQDMPWRNGRTFAYVYDPGHDVEEVIHNAFVMYLGENALDPTVFPSTMQLENEVVSMAAAHLRGDEHVAGSFTSGGTESIFLAMKAARDYARSVRGIQEPEVLLPQTAHASFQKAAYYLDMKATLVPVDPASFRADVRAMRDAITPDTILLTGSAVSYAHGVVDPIAELGQLALEKNLLLHVDGCIGGFILPYFRRLGADVPEFDLSVPGVTSISMDFHKYAFAAKGASVILYKTKDLRRHQFYACSHWTGYTVINTTVQSTKSAGPVAACWAALQYIGDSGYMELARRMLEGTRKIVAGIQAIPGLRLLGQPDSNLICFTCDDAGVFDIIDEMKARDWYIQPQLGFGPSRENIHLSLNPRAMELSDAFLADLGQCVEIARNMRASGQSEAAQLKTVLAGIDFSKLDPAQLAGLLGSVGVDGASLPKRMAGINEIMNSLPAPVREQLLIEYLNGLFQTRMG